jgi:CBS domain-containing protein
MASTDTARLAVADVMTRSVISVTPSASLRAVARLLVEHRLGALPVVGADGTVVGVVSEADLVLHGSPVAGDVMSSPVAVIEPTAGLADAAHAMRAGGVHRLFVVDDRTGTLLGVLSRSDLPRGFLRRR